MHGSRRRSIPVTELPWLVDILLKRPVFIAWKQAEWEAKAKGNCCFKRKMMEDIRREAGVALEKPDYDILHVSREYQREDVTGDIAGKIIAMGKQEDK